MSRTINKLFNPCGQPYLRPFLLTVFALLLLVIAMLLDSQKKVSLDVPDKMNFVVDGTSKVSFDPVQYDELLAVLGQIANRKPIVVENKVVAEAAQDTIKRKKYRKRWRPARPAGWY